ncbi:MAG TPA: hypothetical protein VFM90_10090, partial [Cyclobacteriaceae bacterium]|nr:hypothetical protein [Cyclobacteriaceae bacterium]
VLVAVDEMFQVKIIGDGIAKTGTKKDRIRYKPDAILPDANIEKWAVDIIAEYTGKIIGYTQTAF